MKKRLFAAALALALAAACAVIYLRAGRAELRSASYRAGEEGLTLVIDAGHGGEDGGAVSPSGLTESSVNLDVAARIDCLAAFFGVRTTMTRESEDIAYPDTADTTRKRKAEDQKARLRKIRSAPNAVLISIHQNSYPDPDPSGAQALYAPTEGSLGLAERLQELLVASLDTSNRRAASEIQDTILLMNSVSCPAVLVECAFLSNPREEALLRTDSYRLSLATVITAGFLRSRGELSAVYGTEMPS
ncbi:MAG: N-acetylmuramoyl-L-alanine amidase [Oscillospiraceae bacterium]|jgi:N-acetylmuramoyl-L-alanine amidase|nr:N-acetylmuramoyl-L-alanine amidase [Oscillospiraceae bacterium]